MTTSSNRSSKNIRAGRADNPEQSNKQNLRSFAPPADYADRTGHPKSSANEQPAQLSTDHMVRLLARQMELCSLLTQACEQTASIDEEPDRDIQISMLIESIASRQPLIDELVELNAQMEPYRSNWKQWASTMSSDESTKVQAGFDSVYSAVLAIIDHTNMDRVELERRRDAVGRDMAMMSRQQHGSHAYGSMGFRNDRLRTNRYINERG